MKLSRKNARIKAAKRKKRLNSILVTLVCIGIVVFAYAIGRGWIELGSKKSAVATTTPTATATPAPTPAPQTVRLLSVESVTTASTSEVEVIARQNYGQKTLPSQFGVTKVVFKYQSADLDGTPLTIYGRAFIPSSGTQHSIYGFAPGTTGIGDQCAASVENVAAINWGNYDSHMMMYASQGYASVITDYEGMRDPNRLHHYMVGELEGRAVLDSIRALRNLPQASGKLSAGKVFVGGYSQGGHAAFWADKIAPSYAPDINVGGVIGYGPVMSVQQSISDVVNGSTLNWFGPYVLTSYADYYKKDYNLRSILQPKWIGNLAGDVQNNCINSNISFWGREPSRVYTPEFLASINSPSFSTQYPAFAADLAANYVGDNRTKSAKLINQGKHDNVVLPRQQEAVLPAMCAASLGSVQYHPYEATHYNSMVMSLSDTLGWMKQVVSAEPVATTCVQ